MNSKKWVICFLSALVLVLTIGVSVVIYIDPFFHYHGPRPEFYYSLRDQRHQGDGILRHFAYDGVIIGTSMTENCSASLAGELFGGSFVKTPLNGATFYEINSRLETALRYHPELPVIIRCLDYRFLIQDPREMREDMGTFPTYLYDRNPLNDWDYLLSWDVMENWILPMVKEKKAGVPGGVVNFDDYSRWPDTFLFGKEAALGDTKAYDPPESQARLTPAEEKMCRENIEKNVVSLARKYPDTEFYYFISPYSILFWGDLYSSGTMMRQLEAEKILVEAALECENIRLYSWNTDFDLITDLDHYKDHIHYGPWINDRIFEDMAAGRGLLTRENYLAYLQQEWDFYAAYDYSSLIP